MKVNDNKNDIIVSIIMPAYNAEKTIIRAINSVVEQTILDWELIIINDGSQDKTSSILKFYTSKDNRIKIINREANKGIAYSRNEGLNMATGQYVAFLDSDDTWKKNKLEKQLSYMIDMGIKFSCTSYLVVDIDGTPKKKIYKKESFYTYKDLLKTNFIGCSTVMIDSTLIKNNKMPIVKHEDYATWLNILVQNERIFYVNKELTIYTKSNNSQSGNKIKALIWARRIIYSQKEMSFLKKRLFFLRYVYYTGMKYLEK